EPQVQVLLGGPVQAVEQVGQVLAAGGGGTASLVDGADPSALVGLQQVRGTQLGLQVVRWHMGGGCGHLPAGDGGAHVGARVVDRGARAQLVGNELDRVRNQQVVGVRGQAGG